jgi:hypothetical protein
VGSLDVGWRSMIVHGVEVPNGVHEKIVFFLLSTVKS